MDDSASGPSPVATPPPAPSPVATPPPAPRFEKRRTYSLSGENTSSLPCHVHNHEPIKRITTETVYMMLYREFINLFLDD
jgi:hypothetical protein